MGRERPISGSSSSSGKTRIPMEGGVMETPFVVVEDLLSVFTVSVEIVVLDSWRRICVAVVTPFSACTVYILCRDDASRNARKAAFHFICVIKNLRVDKIISFVHYIMHEKRMEISIEIYEKHVGKMKGWK